MNIEKSIIEQNAARLGFDWRNLRELTAAAYALKHESLKFKGRKPSGANASRQETFANLYAQDARAILRRVA